MMMTMMITIDAGVSLSPQTFRVVASASLEAASAVFTLVTCRSSGFVKRSTRYRNVLVYLRNKF